MSPGALVIRTEARPEIGHGHLMRCFALAQAWKDCSGSVVFAMSQPPSGMIKHPDMESFAYVDTGAGDADEPDRVAALAEQYDARWIVVDGYGFTSEYHRKLKNSARKLLVIDDTGHTGEYVCDLVLDQNAGARESYYVRRQPGTQLLLGPRYALLRREFGEWSQWKRETNAKARKILVTMGGSDPENLSCRAIAALSTVNPQEMQTKVVVGGGNPHLAQLRQMSAEYGGNLEIITDAKMPELMMWADLAVSSAGSTCWELCMLGLPAILIDAADNQIPIARELHQRGIAEYIPRNEATVEAIGAAVERLLIDQEGRSRMATVGRQLVDARGAHRVVAAMRAHGVSLRKAREDDCRVLWQWVNDPDVRKASFVHESVVWKTHTAWFSGKLRDPNCVILIAQDELGNPVGQFRVDLRNDWEGVIDVSISAQRRKSGWGSRVIDLCSLQIFSSTQIGRLHAFVRPENVASLRAFERADFVKVGEEIVNGELAVHYERSKQQSLV